MTNSEIIEEILHEAHILGISVQVFDISNNLQSKGMDSLLAYDTAIKQVLLELNPVVD